MPEGTEDSDEMGEAKRRAEAEAKALAGQQEQESEKLWKPEDEEANPEELAARLAAEPGGYKVDGEGDEPKEPTPSRQFGPDGKLYEVGTDPRLPPIESPEGAKAGVVSVFLVVQERDGRFWSTNDLSILPRLDPDRKATTFDMIPGCSQVISDIEMMKTVQNTVNAMMQTSMAAQEQMRVAKMNEKLASKGIHLPTR